MEEGQFVELSLDPDFVDGEDEEVEVVSWSGRFKIPRVVAALGDAVGDEDDELDERHFDLETAVVSAVSLELLLEGVRIVRVDVCSLGDLSFPVSLVVGRTATSD